LVNKRIVNNLNWQVKWCISNYVHCIKKKSLTLNISSTLKDKKRKQNLSISCQIEKCISMFNRFFIYLKAKKEKSQHRATGRNQIQVACTSGEKVLSGLFCLNPFSKV